MIRRRLWAQLLCSRSRRSSPRRSTRLGLEPLEDRTLPSASLLFDPRAGSLCLFGQTAENTIRESLSPAGFLELAVDGQRHSSDPASAFFDSALAGATASTLTGIRCEGDAQDTLILGNQDLAGSLAVSSDAAVVTEDVAVLGRLAIQACRRYRPASSMTASQVHSIQPLTD